MIGMAGAALRALEAIYRVELDQGPWLQGVCDALVTGFNLGAGLTIVTAHVPSDGPPTITAFAQSGTPTDYAALAAGMTAYLPPEFSRAAHQTPGWVELLIDGPLGAETMRPVREYLQSRSNIHDILGMTASWAPTRSIAVSLPMTRPLEAPRETDRLLRHLGSHLRCAMRIRDGLLDDDAVLDPRTGHVVHAVGAATSSVARERLRAHAKAIDNARASNRGGDDETALAAWRGLVDGTWSLVDRFESDGRRYLVAKRNPPVDIQTSSIASLSTRERQVTMLAATGASNKLIGYELGLSKSTVATHLQRATQKLGCRSRVALCGIAIDAWRADGGLAAGPDGR